MAEKSKPAPWQRARISGRNDRYSHQWRKYRKALLARRLIEAAKKKKSPCVDCAKEGVAFGRAGPWHMDHIVKAEENPALFFVAGNIEVRCPSHHSRREAFSRKGANWYK